MHTRFKTAFLNRTRFRRAGPESGPLSPRRPRASRTGTFFRRLFLTLGVITFVVILIGGLAAIGAWRSQAPSLPNRFVLSIKLDSDYAEFVPMQNPFGETQPSFIDVVDAIDRAGGDNRVKALVVDLEDPPLSVAHVQELRDAILRFRKTGKAAYIYAPSYGDPGRGLGTYYFASAFDRIWMQPVGIVSIGGISAEMPFARALLDKYNVQPEFFQRKEYKSLFETFNNNHMSPASREEMNGLITDIAGQFMTGIEEDKDMKPAALQKIVDQGLFTDEEAVYAGLVDKLDGYEALKRQIALDLTGTKDTGSRSLHKLVDARKQDDKTLENGKLFVDIDRYVADTRHVLSHETKKNAAVIYISGAISDASQSSRAAPLQRLTGFADQFKAAADPTDALITAADDSSIAIIVLRIDSPGGSPGASETIRRAVVYAEHKGKQVVVSMGDECASGGYWIASAGTHIFADPATLTGSIGVAGGKANLAGLWNRFGINWEGVSFGATADMWSFNHPFTPAETARVNDMLDAVYNAFIARVAEGRHMTIAQADKVARGRVWTGRQAKDRGLVDDLGGMDAALDYAARQVGLKDRTQLAREVYPKPQSPFDKLEDLADQTAAPDPLKTLAPVLEPLERAVLAGQYMTYEPIVVR